MLVALVGMPGSGKTTIGRGLALKLGFSFVDSDSEIEKRTGASIPTIFELEGEAGFRKRECAVIEELSQATNLVIATGGGAVLSTRNRELLRSRAVVIYLNAKLDDLVRRTRHDRNRPLLRGNDLRARLQTLLAMREALYAETAHLAVDTGRQPSSTLVVEIISQLRNLAVLPSLEAQFVVKP
jgi:shikimate kinase